ncbi:MAG: phage head closure protein [Tepidisphaeraceae bacterium]
MRERIVIQAEVADGGDTTWGTNTTWVDHARVWANVKAESGGEAVEGQAVVSRTAYTVRIRYLSGVTSRNRLALRDGRLLDVLSVVDPTGKKRELELAAIERQEAA